VVCWHMWMRMNKTNFLEDFQRPMNATYTILKLANDIDSCTHQSLNSHQSDTFFIVWKRSPKGWVKLNCDGDSFSIAGCGGLFRNSGGR
jgi:hypothetical protein